MKKTNASEKLAEIEKLLTFNKEDLEKSALESNIKPEFIESYILGMINNKISLALSVIHT